MNTYIKLFTNELKNMGLSLYDKAVYGSLLTKFQYHNNEEFYTYENFIADELEISESSVKRSIKKLNDVGLISINKKYHKQLRKTVNYYIINNSISDTENFAPITCTTTKVKVEQKPNNEEINGLQEYIKELESANDWLQTEVERLEGEKNVDEPEPVPATDIDRSKLNKAISDFRNYWNDGHDLQDYFENWKNLNEMQIDGICGCLGDISKDELISLYRTWKTVA